MPVKNNYPFISGFTPAFNLQLVEEFFDLPVGIKIFSARRHKIDWHGTTNFGEFEYGFSLGLKELSNDEVFDSDLIWGFETIKEARVDAVSFLAGWCARIRYERRKNE